LYIDISGNLLISKNISEYKPVIDPINSRLLDLVKIDRYTINNAIRCLGLICVKSFWLNVHFIVLKRICLLKI